VTTVNLCEAKTRLCRRVEQAPAGKAVIIARVGKPVARAGAGAVRGSPMRLLLALAFTGPLRLVTADSTLTAYGGPIEFI